MTVALRGELVDFGIADVFQLVGQQCKTGCLELRRGSESAVVLFDCGEVVGAFPGDSGGELELSRRLVGSGVLEKDDAISMLREGRASARHFVDLVGEGGRVHPSVIREMRSRITRDTLFQILQWQDGTFDFVADEAVATRDSGDAVPAQRVLMDGMRQIDEWNAMRDDIPAEDEIFERHPGAKEDLAVEPDPEFPDLERVWGWIDGSRSVRSVTEHSGLDRFDATRVFVALIRADTIRPVSAVRRRPSEPRRKSARSTLLPVTGPIVLLAGIVAWMFLGWPAPQNAARPGAFEGALAVFQETDRRNRAEMARFDLSHRAPMEVGEGLRSPLSSGDALASGGSRLYNRVRSAEGFLLESRR